MSMTSSGKRKEVGVTPARRKGKEGKGWQGSRSGREAGAPPRDTGLVYPNCGREALIHFN